MEAIEGEQDAVSYTHLDVYKRQVLGLLMAFIAYGRMALKPIF